MTDLSHYTDAQIAREIDDIRGLRSGHAPRDDFGRRSDLDKLQAEQGRRRKAASEPRQTGSHPDPLADLELDAARWRALMRCGRIKMQGSAGVDPVTGQRTSSTVHFGAEFWPEPSEYPDLAEKDKFGTAWGVACLTALADAIIERDAVLATEPDES